MTRPVGPGYRAPVPFETRREGDRERGRESVYYFLPWWALLACLAASALAAYLLLGRTRASGSPWALLPLTAVMAPVVLAGAAVAAIALSASLSPLLEDRIAAPKGTGAATTTLEPPAPATATPSASPGASPPTTSPAGSPTASPAASATASASASASP